MGRRKGSLNKVTIEVKAFSASILHDPNYQESLKKRLIAGKAPHMEPLLFHYCYGKPKETGEVTHLHKVYGWLPSQP